jgi:hypothetical protein
LRHLENPRRSIGGQHDTGGPDVLEGARAIADSDLETMTIVIGQEDADGLTSHRGTPTQLAVSINPLSASVHQQFRMKACR